MKLSMFSVGFGDCFLLKATRTNLLVDCGTVGFHNSEYNSFSKFVDYLYNKELSSSPTNLALITHFHSDHYRGFKELVKKGKRDVFKKIYVPYISYDKKTNKPVIFELAFYMYLIYGTRANSGIVGFDILNQINILYELGQSIEVLYAEKAFPFEQEKFKVLWPQKTMEYPSLIDECLLHLDSIIKELPGIESLKKDIITNIIKWYDLIEVQKDIDSNNDSSRGQFEAIYNSHKKLINSLELSRKNDKFSKKLEYIKSTKWYKLFKESCTKLFLKCQNSTSIVFHNYNNKSPILMTGDITKEVIDNHLYNKFHKYYKVVKTPHHGTGSHYSNKLPRGCYILTSTGPRKKYGKISMNYKNHFCKKICTYGYNYCEILDNGQSCNQNGVNIRKNIDVCEIMNSCTFTDPIGALLLARMEEELKIGCSCANPVKWEENI